MNRVPSEIFKAYDIRGVVDTVLTSNVVEMIGQAIGSEARERGLKAIAIGRDGRLSSPSRASAGKWITKKRSPVIDVGMVPTRYSSQRTELCDYTGVMITGSHNPPDYNGMKIVLGGETLTAQTIKLCVFV